MAFSWAEYERESRSRIAARKAQAKPARACVSCGHPILRGKECAACASESRARRAREWREKQRAGGVDLLDD